RRPAPAGEAPGPSPARPGRPECHLLRARGDNGRMNGPRPSDAELGARVKARDRDGFAALVASYQAAVVGAALAITRDAALAEDLAQEVFVAAWRDLGRLRDAGRVGPYLVAAARNHARSAVRRRARRAAAGERGAPPPPEPAPTPHDEAV